jgi:hypothetical protein
VPNAKRQRESGETIAELCFSKTTSALKSREFRKSHLAALATSVCKAATLMARLDGGPTCRLQFSFSSEINLPVTEP